MSSCVLTVGGIKNPHGSSVNFDTAVTTNDGISERWDDLSRHAYSADGMVRGLLVDDLAGERRLSFDVVEGAANRLVLMFKLEVQHLSYGVFDAPEKGVVLWVNCISIGVVMSGSRWKRVWKKSDLSGRSGCCWGGRPRRTARKRGGAGCCPSTRRWRTGRMRRHGRPAIGRTGTTGLSRRSASLPAGHPLAPGCSCSARTGKWPICWIGCGVAGRQFRLRHGGAETVFGCPRVDLSADLYPNLAALLMVAVPGVWPEPSAA